MTNRSAVVIGASGFVGSYLLNAFRRDHSVVGTFATEPLPGLEPLDIAEAIAVRNFFDRHRPEVVLCPAANPHVEGCEREPAATRKINIEGLANVVRETLRVGARIVYFSSEYVFDGDHGPYSEDNFTNPINEYGRQKLAAENLVRENLRDFLIVRISAPYGWERRGKNFVMQMLHRRQTGEPILVAKDQVITPTYISDLAQAVHNLAGLGSTGIFHVAGSECMVRSDFARLVTKAFDLPPALVKPVLTSTMNLSAPRPNSAGLITDKVARVLGHHLSGPEKGLAAMRAEQSTARPWNEIVPA
ncbi:MAG TPA: SDR family oxidoreductase [Terriglobia bacterium]|nr:SDR family oxidoreductase [Terriglobia bacterium]